MSVWVGAFIILECGIIIRGWNWTSHSRANLKPHRLPRHWLETRSTLGKQEWLINVWMSYVDTRWKTPQQIVIFFSIAQRSLDCHGSPGNCITKIIELNGENHPCEKSSCCTDLYGKFQACYLLWGAVGHSALQALRQRICIRTTCCW